MAKYVKNMQVQRGLKSNFNAKNFKIFVDKFSFLAI